MSSYYFVGTIGQYTSVLGTTQSGSATAPSIWVGSSNTGLYSPAANTLGLTTGGTVGLQQNSSQQIYGYRQLRTAKTTAYSILLTDTGTVFCNTGASAEVVLTLPTASSSTFGVWYTFVVSNSVGIQIQLASGQTCYVGASTSSSGGTVTSTTMGSTITITCIAANTWYATSVTGTWAEA